ncbi:MAG: helix-turn-helix domain-containing GNAT family N-acetyltransferase [Chloroflexi bacterium]|nr:helix-turn-helix domain-containing GNAT family N-acetyltransferase [Chloroflexota bacterium]
MIAENMEDRISAVRGFNRFFTRQIGVLREGLLHTPYTLTEARLLFEIAHGDHLTATQLGRELGLDAGYLSRILSRLEGQGLIVKMPSETDGRQRLLSLTPQGREAFAVLDLRSREEVAEMLDALNDAEQQRLLKAMSTIQSILKKETHYKYAEPFFLRPPEPGDLGTVVRLHGELYAREYGWDEHFEALAAQIVADFINNFNPAKERCWLAEMGGELVGSIFCVRLDDDTARLRMLLVRPEARGLGLGTRLVEECIRFARSAGYKKMVLWTNSVLVEARHIYQKMGFKLVEQNAERNFGKDLVGEDWELIL